MKVVVTAQGLELDSMSSPVFGRCPAFLFVDTETLEHEGVANPCAAIGSRAGIEAARFVASRGAQAVLSHNLGPNAFAALQAAGIAVYRLEAVTVRQAVEAFAAGRLLRVTEASGGAPAGAGASDPAACEPGR